MRVCFDHFLDDDGIDWFEVYLICDNGLISPDHDEVFLSLDSAISYMEDLVKNEL